MSFFSIFKKKDETIYMENNTPNSIGAGCCDFCSRDVIPLEKAMALAFKKDKSDPKYYEEQMKAGRKCHVCAKVSCANCSILSAKKEGVRNFICPSCKSNIHDNKL